ncbi:MAG: ISAs1 family transposase [Bacteroidota bacterium]
MVDSGNHYVIQVKGNQPTLYKELHRISLEQPPLDYFEEHEKGHGRHSSWFVHVFNATDSPKAKEWKHLRRVIHVHKKTIHTKTKKESHNDRYYISDRFEIDAKEYHEGIRGHWKIENSLHWVKDVIHGEDESQFKVNNAPMNAATFSSIAINIHRANGNYSITDGNKNRPLLSAPLLLG